MRWSPAILACRRARVKPDRQAICRWARLEKTTAQRPPRIRRALGRYASVGAGSLGGGAAAFLLADLYDRQKKPELAFYYLKYASQCLSTGHDTALYADCLTRLAEVSSATGHLSIALKAAEDLEVMEKRQYGENSQQLQAAREMKRDVLQKIETENPALLKPLATQSAEKGGKRSVKRHAQ